MRVEETEDERTVVWPSEEAGVVYDAMRWGKEEVIQGGASQNGLAKGMELHD